MSKIRDPIHGFIDLNEDEMLLINSMPVSRLRYMKCMGLASKVALPAAVHTLFEHALGTSYMMKRLANLIPTIDDDDKNALILGSLIHPIHNLPFSHSLRFLKLNQEQRLSKKDIFEWFLDPERLKVFFGNSNANNYFIKYLIKIKDRIIRYWAEEKTSGISEPIFWITYSVLSANALDFIPRDAYYTGISLRPLNLQWFLDNLRWDGENPNITGESIVLLIHTLFHLRLQSKRLIIKRRHIADRMMCKLLELAIKSKILSLGYFTKIEEFMKLNDDFLWYLLDEKLEKPASNRNEIDLMRIIFHTLKKGDIFERYEIANSRNMDEELWNHITNKENSFYANIPMLESKMSSILDRPIIIAFFPDLDYYLKRTDEDETRPDWKLCQKIKDEYPRLAEDLEWAWYEKEIPIELNVYSNKIDDTGKIKGAFYECLRIIDKELANRLFTVP